MKCAFYDKCINADQECDGCQYCYDAVLQDYFEFDDSCGEEEPTREELDSEIQG